MKRVQKPRPKKSRGEAVPPTQVHTNKNMKRQANKILKEIQEELDAIDEAIKRGD